jgi:hypothetical protein
VKTLTDLRFLFSVVVVVEVLYALAGILTPPALMATFPGWNLTPDGAWLARLLGVSLASQAMIAWLFRRNPHLGVALALALYQVGSATVDWAMWLLLWNDGIFPIEVGRIAVAVSIPLHYTIGVLLLVGVYRARQAVDAASVS